MKKFFQRLDNSSNYQRDYQRDGAGGGGLASNSSTLSNGSSFIGKVFTLGQYNCTVEDTIAEGGFALVFLVKAQNGVRYALKRLHVNNEQDLANCKREIEIAKKVGSHKNIVLLVESMISQTRNGAYQILLLMQHCKGQLLQLMNERIGTGFSEEEILRILCDICEAIGRLHQNDPPIIHRDLKVENILISETGNYLLCDFGSATTKVLSTDSGHSALVIEDEIKRYTTLAYRSPEMVDVYSGKPITTKADIWALGCLLYKICFFNLPFGESTLAIQNAQLTIPDSHADRYSKRLLTLMGYMLLPDPADRPDIYQVSGLAFELAGTDCPVKNPNKSKFPSWSELRIPPTESYARELKKATAAATTTSLTVNSHQQNPNESERSTSVAPRQRPKASININSVLPTSPVAFQRAVTPSDPALAISATTSITSSSNTLTVKDTPVAVAPTASNGITNSHSFSSSGQLFSGKMENEKDWVASGSGKQSQFSSNPQLNNNNSSVVNAVPKQQTSNESSNNQPTNTAVISSKNPFISSLPDEEPTTTTTVAIATNTTTLPIAPPPPLPRPPSNTRRTQTPPGITLSSVYSQNFLGESSSGQSSNNSGHNLPSSFHHSHHHRRNQSDTSAFNSKDIGNTSSTAVASTSFVTTSQASSLNITSKSSANNHHSDHSRRIDGTAIGGSVGHSGGQQRVRSLNPFEDPNDDSYEDQLFGHEFDKIRMENQQEFTTTTTTVCDGGNNVTTTTTGTGTGTASSPTNKSSQNYDPFEAVPFNTVRLKRYFERQQSDLQQRQHGGSSSAKPLLINVTSSSSGNRSLDGDDCLVTGTGTTGTTKPQNQNTVITIRSNNDYTITSNNNNNSNDSLKPELSSRIVSIGGSGLEDVSGSVETGSDQLSKVTTTDKSISSSSQGNNTFSPATHYMPLYSSDTAEDDDDEDDDEDNHHNSNGANYDDDDDDEYDDRLDDERHNFETPGDLTKPLVDDDEEDEDDGDDGANEDVNLEEDHDEHGEESSIGTASDLQQSDDSDDDSNEDDNEDDDNNSGIDDEVNNVVVDCSDSSDDELDNDEDSNGNSDDGFELVDFDGNLDSTRYRYGLVINAVPIVSKQQLSNTCSGLSGSHTVGASSDSAGKDWIPNNKGGNRLGTNVSRIQIKSLDCYGLDNGGDNNNQNMDNVNHNNSNNNNDDSTSVGEVLSNCSVSSSSKNVDTIDHLIGHIEGNRPLLDEEDDEDNDQTPALPPPPSVVATIKPFIEVDDFEPILVLGNAIEPNQQSYSMSSSIHSTNSMILQTNNEPVPPTPSFTFVKKDSFPNEKDLKDNLAVSSNKKQKGNNVITNFESLSLQQIVDESEENRRLDEEVAQSLNSQVLLDQLVNKDLFGSIPFTDEELMNKNKKLQLLQLKKKNKFPNETSDITTIAAAAPPPLTSATGTAIKSSTTQLKFENSFTEPVIISNNNSKKSAMPPSGGACHQESTTVIVSPPKHYVIPKTSSDTTISSNLSKSTDLFGAVPFSGTSASSAAGSKVAPETQYRKTSQPTLSTTCGGGSTSIVSIKPKPLPLNLPLKPIQSSFPTKSTCGATVPPTALSAIPISNKLADKSASSLAQVNNNTSSSNPVSLLTGSLGRLGKSNQVQKSNSKLKSKVAKKYEVVESDDDIDGLLDDGCLDDENEQLNLTIPDTGSSKDKKKKKDKKEKEKPEKKPKEKKEDKKSKSKEKPEKEKKNNEKSKEKDKSKTKEKEQKLSKADKAELKAKEKELLKSENSKSASKILDEIAGSSVVGGVIGLKLTKTSSATSSTSGSVGISSNVKPAKPSKSDSKSSKKSDKKKELKNQEKHHKNKHQAFANMSFEDEREHPSVIVTSSSVIPISTPASSCTSTSGSIRQAVAARLSLPKLHLHSSSGAAAATAFGNGPNSIAATIAVSSSSSSSSLLPSSNTTNTTSATITKC